MFNETYRRRFPKGGRHALRLARLRIVSAFDRSICLKEASELAGHDVCLLACFAHQNEVSRRTRLLAHAWKAQGFKVILVVASHNKRLVKLDDALKADLCGALVRGNFGYDFGSWSTGIRRFEEIADASLLALANDSVYGPLDNFGPMIARVRNSTADIVGMTDSFQIVHHLQSYLVFYKRKTLQDHAFRTFWNHRRWGERDETIRRDELPFLYTMQMAGLTVETLFPTASGDDRNPSLCRWRELIDAGFPFVKVQLLRDNPFGINIDGWREVLKSRGFAAENVVADLGPAFSRSAAAFAS